MKGGRGYFFLTCKQKEVRLVAIKRAYTPFQFSRTLPLTFAEGSDIYLWKFIFLRNLSICEIKLN